MKNHIALQGVGILTLCIFTQSLIGSFGEHKGMVPITEQFIHAVQTGDEEEIIKLHTQYGCLVNCEDSLTGWSALHFATKAQRKSIIKLLLELKANVHIKTSVGNTPLHLAAKERGNEEIIKLLIERQADINGTNKGGDTPLRLAAKRNDNKTIELLVSHGACYPLRNTSPQTHKRKRSKEHLAEEGELITPRVRHKADPQAFQNKTLCEMPLLASRALQQSEMTPKVIQGFTQSLCETGVDVLLKDLTKPDYADTRRDWTPLHKAAFKGQDATVFLLLKTGVNKEAVDMYGSTPLHVASDRGHEVVVDLLLSAGAHVDALALQGFTPLHGAALNGHWTVVIMLLVAGAKVDAISNFSHWTPLHLASSRGHERAVTMLLIAGANKKAVDRYGATPLDLAEMNDHKATVKILKTEDVEAS